MWCPRCGAEFRAGYTRCSECGAALVEQDPAKRVSTHTLSTAPTQVFDFGERTVRDGAGRLLGSCRYERRACQCRDVHGVPVWTWKQYPMSLYEGFVVDGDGEQIGSLERHAFWVDGEEVGTIAREGRASVVSGRAGGVVARVTDQSRFLAMHAQVEVRFERNVSPHERLVVASLACGYEASRTLGE